MKIGIITDTIRENSTGIGRYSRNLAQALIKTYKMDEFFFIDYEKNIFNQKHLVLVENRSKKFFKTIVWHNILPRKIENMNMDFILNLTGCPHLYPYKQKEIFFVYDSSLLILPCTHPLSGVFYNKLFFKKTAENCHKIITISKNSRRDLINYYNIPDSKIKIIYPIISNQHINEKKPKISINNQYVLYVGTVESRKNIVSLIKAFYLFKKTDSQSYKLIVSGNKGFGYSNIFNLIKKLKLENSIIFTGYITEEEKKYLYRHADLFVYPSLYEGFGIPPLEAMGYGCPVITSNTSSLPEVVGDAGIMISPYDVNGLSLAMEKVLSDKELRKKMIKKGFQQAKKFYLPNNLDQLLT